MSYDPMYDLIPAHFAHDVSGYEPDGYVSGRGLDRRAPGAHHATCSPSGSSSPSAAATSGVCAVAIPVRLLGARAATSSA